MGAFVCGVWITRNDSYFDDDAINDDIDNNEVVVLTDILY